MRGAARLAGTAAAQNIDAAILIDSWSFSRIAAGKIRQAAPNAKLFKYVAAAGLGVAAKTRGNRCTSF